MGLGEKGRRYMGGGGQTLTRHLTNIRLRIIKDFFLNISALFLYTLFMCSFTKIIFCSFHGPARELDCKKIRMTGEKFHQMLFFNFFLPKFGIEICVTHKQAAYRFVLNIPRTRKIVAQDWKSGFVAFNSTG